MARRNGAILLKTIRELRARGEVGGPPVVAGWMTRTTVAEVVQAPAGRYRWMLAQIKRAHRGDLGTKMPSRRIRRDSQDVRWSNEVRARDDWTCRRCHLRYPEGAHEFLDAAHVVPRGFRKTRFAVDNGVALCKPCHQHMTDHPTEAKAFF